MNEVTLKLDTRSIKGKRVSGLRSDGYIPSVIYDGEGNETLTKSLTGETTKVVKVAGRHTPVSLVIDGKKKLAIIKDVDIDPIRQTYRHIAFHAINQDDIITTSVPIVLTGMGESIAEKAGLIILQAIENIEIKAKPANLPSSIEMSIVELATDEDKLTVADVKLPNGVEFNDKEQDMELVIANVYEPSALQAENEAAAGDADEETEVPVEGEEGAEADVKATDSDAKPETSEDKK